MKYAADFRQIAREALSGKWMIAVLVGLVASLLGGGISYYAMWALAAVVFALAVYYTVKQL